MNELIITEKSNLTAIADAVRSKTGTTTPMTLGDIVNSIYNIESGDSDASIETCAVTITFIYNMSGTFPSYVTYTTVDGGKIVNRVLNDSDITFSGLGGTGGATARGAATINCVVGTSVYMANENFAGNSFITSDNITLNGTIGIIELVYEAVINSGSTATIEAVG